MNKYLKSSEIAMPSTAAEVKMCRLLETDIEWAFACIEQEGWNPGLFDLEIFSKIDPYGFIVATIDGDPVGLVSAVNYDPQFAFVGLLIVDSHYRGKKVGLRLAQAAREHIGPNRTIGVDAVIDRQRSYIRLFGFEAVYETVRYEGVSQVKPVQGEADLRPYDSVWFDEIVKYDRIHFPADRELFLKSWLSMPQSQTRVFFENDQICGYGTIRLCRDGWKIGPLFAQNRAVAAALLDSLVKTIGSSEIFWVDIPMSNPEAVAMADQYNLKPKLRTVRMYCNGRPTLPTNEIFGVTTLELG
jgi:GNAT superfamily N-acetyltransferase